MLSLEKYIIENKSAVFYHTERRPLRRQNLIKHPSNHQGFAASPVATPARLDRIIWDLMQFLVDFYSKSFSRLLPYSHTSWEILREISWVGKDSSNPHLILFWRRSIAFQFSLLLFEQQQLAPIFYITKISLQGYEFITNETLAWLFFQHPFRPCFGREVRWRMFAQL